MPELPEVQTIVDDLNKKIIGRRIIGVWFDWPKTIKKPNAVNLKKQIKNLIIQKVLRRGKNILVYLQKSQRLNVPPSSRLRWASKNQIFLLLIHQKMTGHLLVGRWKVEKFKSLKFKVKSLIKGPLEEKVNNYIHLIFYFDDGEMLALSDLRKFAKVIFGKANEIESLSDLIKLGPDPFDKRLNVSNFKNLIKNEKRKIKQVLMDQEVIVGIGNIYSDEILWLAKVHPLILASNLSDKQISAIYFAMKKIFKKALKLRGTSTSDFRDTAGIAGRYAKVRYVYQREGEKCLRNNGVIKRIKINSRSAHFCPQCQKIENRK